jgi:hypothetical protein
MTVAHGTPRRDVGASFAASSGWRPQPARAQAATSKMILGFTAGR